MDYQNPHQRVILYYPKVLINPGTWLKQALLYWDTVGSIVPYELDRRIINSSWIRELQDEGAFIPFRPEDIFNRNPNLGTALIEEFREKVNSQQFQLYRNVGIGQAQHFDIYSEKIPGQLTAWLEDEELVQRIDERRWRFERHMGMLYMALLAKYMADASQFTTIPGSDYGLYKDLLFKSYNQENSDLGLSLRLKNILPTPRLDATLSDILRFRRQRHDELLAFRQEIDQFQSELKQAPNYPEVRDLTTRFSERFVGQVNNLYRVFDDGHIPFVLGTIENLIKVDTLPLIGLFSTQVQIPLGIQIAGAAALGGITIRKYWLDHRNEERRILRENSFSYLYLAQRQGII